MAVALVARGFGYSGTVGSRLAPVALLLVPGLFVGRFVVRLTADLRRYLWRTVVHPRTRLVAVTTEALTVVVIAVGAVAPEGMRLHLFDAALGLAAVSLFSPSGAQGPRRRRPHGAGSRPPAPPADPVIGTPVLWLIAGSFAAVAVLGGVVAFDPAVRSGGILVMLGCVAAGAATVRAIRRRCRPGPAGSRRWRR